MGKLRWYKRDPDAALAGMMELTLEERGAYNTVLDLIYARDGLVDDDDRFIAGWLRVDVRIWKRIRTVLIEKKKLYAVDGALRNSRADAEVDKGLSRIASASDAGLASAAKRKSEANKTSGIASTSVQLNSQLSTTTTKPIQTESSLRSLVQSDGWPADFREQFWKAYPRKSAKLAAMKALEAVRKRGAVTWDRLLSTVAAYAATADPQFTKHPATWLNQGCWDDEPPKSGKPHGTPRNQILSAFDDIARDLAGVCDVRDGAGAANDRLLPQGGGQRSSLLREDDIGDPGTLFEGRR